MLAVFRKEMVETLRDRRTLLSAVVLPALTMPLVVLAVPLLIDRQQRALRDQPVRVAVAGGEIRELVEAGVRDGVFAPVTAAAPVLALQRGEVDAVLAPQPAVPGQPQLVAVLYDGTRPASRAAIEKITRVAAALAQRDLEAALRAGGASAGTVIRILVDPRDVAPAARAGGALLATALPFFLAVWLLLGGQYAALDVGIGERERGTLEGLLAAPPSRSALVAGKFLAVLVPALLALLVMLASAMLAIRLGGRSLIPGAVRVGLPLGSIPWLLLAGTALGGFLSAAQLTLSLAARTLREAQQAFTALYLLVAVPVILEPLLVGSLDAPRTALVPVLNAVWTIRRVLLAESQPWEAALTAASLAAATAVVLVGATRLLEAEIRRIR
ncbi:MAG: ABC transporter permease subunit [Armatimonadota bacterium]|nr:ABC transporter permease subunit [Armatimonadota bacterium]MDR7549743.1 ABC transporter permease subunit [Armatimonadota bacterium]